MTDYYIGSYDAYALSLYEVVLELLLSLVVLVRLLCIVGIERLGILVHQISCSSGLILALPVHFPPRSNIHTPLFNLLTS